MPPKGKLSEAAIADVEKWIALGAALPKDVPGTKQAALVDWDKERQYWAFQPPRQHALPQVKDKAWPKGDLDYFVLAELEKRGLAPVRPATKLELIRRATLDLIGLPPTPEEIDAFLKDSATDAYAKLIDRLLASPAYGERWGRYWLDVARYADDQALALAKPLPHAPQYRDWVVRAFNSDMPYDQFLRLQLAGDMLTEPADDPAIRLGGLGFQGLGAEYHKGNFAAQVMADELDDRVDTLTRGLLGLTVACARCHDHKYDPIPTRDYYSLASAYQGANMVEMPLASDSAVKRFRDWEQEKKRQETTLVQWQQERLQACEAALERSETISAGVLSRRLSARSEAALRRRRARPGGEAEPCLFEAICHLPGRARRGSAPELKAWKIAADKALSAKLAIIPDEVLKIADELQTSVRSAVKEQDQIEAPLKAAVTRALPSAGRENILKAFWMTPRSPFFVDAKALESVLSGPDLAQYRERQTKLQEHIKSAPPALVLSHGVKGGGQPMRVHIRGRVETLGEDAPPGFLQIVKRPETGSLSNKFTRLDLARAIATPQNPLTARVFVNRVWQHHFGRGIVATPSNFGKLGDRPTHPELLDTLAARFVASGWSIKALHRELMASATYQLSSDTNKENALQDPENRYLWRATPHRLDVEAWRDSLLAVSGRLERTLGGPSLDPGSPANVRRTLYSFISRSIPNAMLTTFDFPDANVSSAQRNATTVPQQQLFVLNSGFMIDCAKAFAARLIKAAPSDGERIDSAFRLAFGRLPTDKEKDLGLEFLHTAATNEKLTPWEQYAQALLATNEFTWVE